MKKTTLKESFLPRAKKSNTCVILFEPKVAIELINECKLRGIPILGIDGFFIIDQKVQPSMEFSVDFSSKSYSSCDTNSIYSMSISFIQDISKEKDIYFEVIYDE